MELKDGQEQPNKVTSSIQGVAASLEAIKKGFKEIYDNSVDALSVIRSKPAVETYSEYTMKEHNQLSNDVISAIHSAWRGSEVSKQFIDLNSNATMLISEAALIASNPSKQGGVKWGVPPSSTSVKTFASPAVGSQDSQILRHIAAVENYSLNHENLQFTQAATITYSMKTVGELTNSISNTFFPVVVVPAGQTGVIVCIDINNVLDDFQYKRDPNTAKNGGRVNILRAAIDATILEGEFTKFYPQFSEENKSCFVDEAIFKPFEVQQAGATVLTSYLKANKNFNIISLAENDALAPKGEFDFTDKLDASVNISELVFNNGSQTFIINKIEEFGTSQATPSPQGDTRKLVFTFETHSIPLKFISKDIEGKDIEAFKSIEEQKLTAYVGVAVGGTVNIEFGDCTGIGSNGITLSRLIKEDGTAISNKDPLFTKLSEELAKFTNVGVALDARMVNSNRRQRGILLDTNRYGIAYAIPLLSPFTVLAPQTETPENDANAVLALINASRMYLNNCAVKKLISISDTLERFTTTNEKIHYSATPDQFGIGAELIADAWFSRTTLDLGSTVNSVRSKERLEDIRATICTTIAEDAARAYREIGMGAAIAAYCGTSVQPVILVGTNDYLASFIMEAGELRSLGLNFNYKVGTSALSEIGNTIFWSFGVHDPISNNVINPLHFGACLWSPEAVVRLNLSRNNSHSREITVQPAFRHILVLPVLGRIDVINVPKAARGAIPFHIEGKVSTIQDDGDDVKKDGDKPDTGDKDKDSGNKGVGPGTGGNTKPETKPEAKPTDVNKPKAP